MKQDILELEEAVARFGHGRPEVLTRGDGSGYVIRWGNSEGRVQTRREVLAVLRGACLALEQPKV